jgi:copper chaperone NosL
MPRQLLSKLNLVFFLLVFSSVLVHAGDAGPLKPTEKDKCPVCGMFVAKYPDWVAEIIWHDGSVVFFDGAKDLFKYYFAVDQYSPSKSQQDIAAIYVTEYYDLKLIDGLEAYYVIGSDVYGPMGRELVPFESEEEAEEFLKDHNGKMVVRFTDVKPDLIKTLD